VANGRRDEWTDSSEVFAPAEVEAVLIALGVEIRDETDNDFISFCPYHGNTDTPAFSTSKTYGYSVCFNPSCAKGSEYRLTLEGMARDLKGLDHFTAKRFVHMHKARAGVSFRDKFDAINIDEIELPPFPAEAIEAMHKRFMATAAAVDYMKGRGFEKDTIAHFKVGFTLRSNGPVYRASDMVVVPAYDHKGVPVGLVGRSITGKDFKNFGPKEDGTGFHKSKIIWNLQNARKHEAVIICESAFDAMRIHQAGYPNVVALLGGTLSRTQTELLNRHFAKVIIFTDNENESNGSMTYHRHCAKCLKQKLNMCRGHKPGRDLGMKIATSLPRLKTYWAAYDDKHIYARDVKDATDMTDDEIRQCLRNSIAHFEYVDWVA
jgi:DNA primase